MKTDDTATNKGTVLLRNPLPKYSFQPKLDKKETARINKETDKKNTLIETKPEPDSKTVESQKYSNLNKLNQNDTSSIGSELKADQKLESLRQEKKEEGKALESNSDLHIGVLVNSFPQNSVQNYVDQTAEVTGNQDNNSKTGASDIEPEVVKSMIEKLKPVNIVDPISCSSGTKLSHSYSESAINMTSSGFPTQREPVSSTGQDLTAFPSVSNSSNQISPVQEQTGSHESRSEQGVTEAGSVTEINPGVVELGSSNGGDTVHCNCDSKIRQLEEEKQMLKQQLEVQLQVVPFSNILIFIVICSHSNLLFERFGYCK